MLWVCGARVQFNLTTSTCSKHYDNDNEISVVRIFIVLISHGLIWGSKNATLQGSKTRDRQITKVNIKKKKPNFELSQYNKYYAHGLGCPMHTSNWFNSSQLFILCTRGMWSYPTSSSFIPSFCTLNYPLTFIFWTLNHGFKIGFKGTHVCIFKRISKVAKPNIQDPHITRHSSKWKAAFNIVHILLYPKKEYIVYGI